jgi:hypothetical protein
VSTNPKEQIEVRVLFELHILSQMTQLLQVGITTRIHRETCGWFRPTDELAQCSQVRQAGDATTPDYLRAAVVANLDEPPKVA